jgi:hypothetical protein
MLGAVHAGGEQSWVEGFSKFLLNNRIGFRCCNGHSTDIRIAKAYAEEQKENDSEDCGKSSSDC